METGTVTLADFLLARIDTESERARLFEESALLVRDALGYATCGRDPIMSLRPSHMRVQADCRAKRRIVEELSGRADIEGGGYEIAVSEVLRLLALPYADHPDYRDEWRP